MIIIILPSKVEHLGFKGRMEVDVLTELGGEGYWKAEAMVEPSTVILYSSPPWEVSKNLEGPAWSSDSSKVNFHVPNKMSPKVFVFQLELFQLLYSMTTQLLYSMTTQLIQHVHSLQNDHRQDHIAKTINQLHQFCRGLLINLQLLTLQWHCFDIIMQCFFVCLHLLDVAE